MQGGGTPSWGEAEHYAGGRSISTAATLSTRRCWVRGIPGTGGEDQGDLHRHRGGNISSSIISSSISSSSVVFLVEIPFPRGDDRGDWKGTSTAATTITTVSWSTVSGKGGNTTQRAAARDGRSRGTTAAAGVLLKESGTGNDGKYE